MKKLIVFVVAAVVVGLLTLPAMAQYSNTLYGQEGTGADGGTAIDASNHGPSSDVTDNYTNWKWQTGAGSWSGVYSWDGDAWLEIASDGDEQIDVECDIELFWSETIENNKIYFHVGNPSTLTTPDKTAYVNGTYAGNHPEYVGISFNGTSKGVDDFETGGPTGYTGKVLGGMVGTIDNHGTDISDKSFDIQFLLSLNGGAYVSPSTFGAGAHETIPATLWWHPADTGMLTALAGTMSWQVRIFPTAIQADGNYVLDPVIVVAPEL
jgi:hypothetical protein